MQPEFVFRNDHSWTNEPYTELPFQLGSYFCFARMHYDIKCTPWAMSHEPRFLLTFDVWNSFLTPAERDLVSTVTHGVNEYNEGESPFRQGG